MFYYNIFKKLLNKNTIISLLILIIILSLYYNKNNLILETYTMRENLNLFETGVKKMSEKVEDSVSNTNKYLNDISSPNGQIQAEPFIENMDCQNINIEEQTDGATTLISDQCNILEALEKKNE